MGFIFILHFEEIIVTTELLGVGSFIYNYIKIMNVMGCYYRDFTGGKSYSMLISIGESG